MKKLLVISIILVLILGLILSGCSKQQKSANPEDKKAIVQQQNSEIAKEKPKTESQNPPVTQQDFDNLKKDIEGISPEDVNLIKN